MKLKNDQHERFCQEYLIDLNITRAATDASFSKKTARTIGSKLLTRIDIQNRIAELMEKRSKRTEITQDRVLRELACLGHSNIKDYIKHAATGFIQFKDIDKISEEDARAIESIKVNYKEGKIEFKLHSKTRTLDMIGRHLGMFTDKIEHSGQISFQSSEKFMPKNDKEKLFDKNLNPIKEKEKGD